VGRTFIVDAYVNAVLRAHGSSHLPDPSWVGVRVLVGERDYDQLGRTGGIGLLPKKPMGWLAFRGELPHAVCMVRASMGGLLRSVLSPLPAGPRGLLVYSMWSGYQTRGRTAAFLRKMEGLGLRLETLHTSGHASPDDLRKLVEAMRPGCVVPIHTEAAASYPGVFPHARVCLHPDGEWWEV
jgi:ribonuclease J